MDASSSPPPHALTPSSIHSTIFRCYFTRLIIITTIPNSTSPSQTLKFPSISIPLGRHVQTPTVPGVSCSDDFRGKVLFLDSLGLASLGLLSATSDSSLPPLSLRSTIDLFTSSAGLNSLDLLRVLQYVPRSPRPLAFLQHKAVLTFLLREAGVDSVPSLHTVIIRHPRLLASSFDHRLRPTLYFLQSIVVTQVHKHTYLLSCSVEDRLNLLRGMGLASMYSWSSKRLSLSTRVPELEDEIQELKEKNGGG